MEYTMEKIIATNIIRKTVKKVREQLPAEEVKLDFTNEIEDYAKLIHMSGFVTGVCIMKDDFLEEIETLDTDKHEIYKFNFLTNDIGEKLPMDKEALIAMGDAAKFIVWYPNHVK